MADIERLQRETRHRKKSSLEAAGDWLGGAWNTISTGYADPKRERDRLANQTAGNTLSQDAYNRYGDRMAPIAGEAQRSGAIGATNAASADNRLLQSAAAPRVSDPRQIGGQRVLSTTENSIAGQRAANLGLQQAQGDARSKQDYAVELLQRSAEGSGPSRAQGLIQANAARAGANIERAGVGANRQFTDAATAAQMAYGDASGNAALQYGDAFAGQQAAAQQAAINAARQTQGAGEAAVRQQAAAIAGARGNNIGASLLAGMNNAATTMAGANRDASAGMFDAQRAATIQAAAQQRQAAANAAAVQRQAAANQAMADSVTGSNLGMAQIGAAEQQALADAQAAEIASQEQIAAMSLLNQGVGQMRGQDLQSVQAGVDIGQLGLGIDSLRTNTDLANRDSDIAVQQQNAANLLAAQTTNANLLAGNQALNSANLNAVANRGQDLYTSTLGMRGAIAGDTAMMPIRQTELEAEYQDRAYDRSASMMREAASGRQKTTGGLVNMGAGALVGLMSDKRTKTKVKNEPVPDFSRVKSRSWEYKRKHKPEGGKGRFVGGMADEYPEHVVTRGDDGIYRVDMAKTLMSLTAAVGDLQRKRPQPRRAA